MKARTLVVAGVLMATSLSVTGCALFLIGAGAAAGAGAVVYVSGELKASDEVSVDRAYAAALRAMDDLQFRVTKKQKDALAAEIVARRADDTPITIRIKRQSEAVTEVRIRVGVWGDEALSRAIHDKIRSHY